jgi:hypothetical protein
MGNNTIKHWGNAFLINRDGPRAPTAVGGPLRTVSLVRERKPVQLQTAWKTSSHRITCVKKTMNGTWRLESKLYSKLQTVTPPEKVRPCDLQQLIKACGIDGIPNECLRHLPRRPLVHWTHLINHFIQWMRTTILRIRNTKCKLSLRILTDPFLYTITPDDGLDLSWNMLWYTCLIKHAETLLRTKDCCIHSLLHAQQDALTQYKDTSFSLNLHLQLSLQPPPQCTP